MAERTKYAPGTFSWTDLTTTDQAGRKRFTASCSAGTPTTTGRRGHGLLDDADRRQGGRGDLPADAAAARRRCAARWNSYVTVESADESADRAGKLGATVIAPPFDVMDVGRMAVIQDPQGAVLQVWEPKLHIGASLVNAPGALPGTSSPLSIWMARRTSTASCSGGRSRRWRAWRCRTWSLARRPATATAGCAPRRRTSRPTGSCTSAPTTSTPPPRSRPELGGTTLMAPMDIGIGKIARAAGPAGRGVRAVRRRFRQLTPH